MTEIQNVNLEMLEFTVNHRQHAAAGTVWLEALRKLRAGAEFIGHPTDDGRKLQLYTRAAAALATLLADPGFSLSPDGFSMLAVEHEAIQALAEASAFDHFDHVAHSLVKNPQNLDPKKYDFFDANCRAKYFLAYCLNGETDMNFELMFKNAAQTALPLYLGMLAHRVALHPKAHERREELLKQHRHFADLKLPDGLLSALSDAYMYCSYGVGKDKHEAKRTFSKLLREMVGRHCKLPSKDELKRRRGSLCYSVDKDGRPNGTYLDRSGINGVAHGKPTMLIPIEWMSSFHAMYRCYAPSIRQLREHFWLVGSCKPKDIDPVARELFDEFLWLNDDSVILSDLVDQINQLAPDVIYYPSVGMALWWVALAQVRLAPIQMMTLGHPATSMSPAMDYVIAEAGQATPECFSERILELPMNAIQFEERADSSFLPERPALRPQPDVLRVAIPSMAVKITVPFLAALRRIKDNFEQYHNDLFHDDGMRPTLEFHFFPNQLGLIRSQAVRQLQRWLPGCVVHGRDNYIGYMQKLGACDVHLSTFPFGGTNSLIDSMLLGIPIVCLEGKEPHEKFDALMLRRILQAGCVADNVDDYVAIASNLLKDNMRRCGISNAIRDTDIRAEFFGERTGDAKDAFGKSVAWVWRNHDSVESHDIVKQQGGRVLTPWLANYRGLS